MVERGSKENTRKDMNCNSTVLCQKLEKQVSPCVFPRLVTNELYIYKSQNGSLLFTIITDLGTDT